MHRSDVYLVDLSVLSLLAQYFTKMVPVRGVKFDRNIRPRFSPPGHTLPTSPLPIAQRCIGYHYPTSLTLPTLHHPESCRTCQKREGVISRICSQCTKEGKTRALYGEEMCQRADWQRHKAEHPGTQPWGVESNYPDLVLVPLPPR